MSLLVPPAADGDRRHEVFHHAVGGEAPAERKIARFMRAIQWRSDLTVAVG
jgi:hypothetical protein